MDVPVLPEGEPSGAQTLGDMIKAMIPDPTARIRLDTKVDEVLRATLAEIGIKNFPATHDQGSINEQFALRVRRYDEILVDLQTIVVLLAHWGDTDQGRLLTKVLARLAEGERPSAGLILWLHLMAYPVLAVMYAGGIAALAAGRYDTLHLCLTTQVRWNRSRSEQAAPILIPTVTEVTTIFDAFKVLPGMAQRYVPRSEHQLVALQPIIEDQLFLGRSYEDLFDQFEIMLALSYADLKPGTRALYWGPPGRFAYAERSIVGGGRPFTRFVESVRAQGQAWPGFAAGFFNGSLSRFNEVADGYAELIKTIGPVF